MKVVWLSLCGLLVVVAAVSAYMQVQWPAIVALVGALATGAKAIVDETKKPDPSQSQAVSDDSIGVQARDSANIKIDNSRRK